MRQSTYFINIITLIHNRRNMLRKRLLKDLRYHSYHITVDKILGNKYRSWRKVPT